MSEFNLDKSITVRQGETLSFVFTQTRTEDASPIDITGDKFRLAIRKTANSFASTVQLSSDAPLVDPAGSNLYNPAGSPTSSTIGVIDGPEGKWRLVLSAYRTKQIPAGDSVYEIDQIKPDGTVSTLLAGDFSVTKELS